MDIALGTSGVNCYLQSLFSVFSLVADKSHTCSGRET